MTTLAVDKARTYELGTRNEFPVVATDIVYEGAAVGLVAATGHARPLAAGDRFAGFAEQNADNATGGAGAVTVRVVESGKVQLAVAGAVITDVGQPVYATDDDTFVFSPVGGVFVGLVHRFVAAGQVIVDFDAPEMRDPYAGHVHELKSANYTVDAEDSGKWLWVDTDAVVITLPAVEGIRGLRVGNLGSYGTVLVTVTPNASDMIEGPDITAADTKGLLNTKATQQRGDFIEIEQSDANGWVAVRKRGTWARAA